MTDPGELLAPNETAGRLETGPVERAPASQRDPVTGRWLPGNKAALGAGGFGGRMREFREAFLCAITPEEFAQAARVLLGLALQGDTSALALLCAYGLGRPIQPTPERADGGPAVVFEPLLLRGIDPEAMREGRYPDDWEAGENPTDGRPRGNA